jgi:hypothetical protein
VRSNRRPDARVGGHAQGVPPRDQPTVRLEFPHILSLLDAGEAEGRGSCVMCYVRGGSLGQRLGHGRRLALWWRPR